MPGATSSPRDPQWGPWLTSVGSRKQILLQSSRNVVYLAEEPNGSTFRYRCYAMAQAINLWDRSYKATWFYDYELDVVRENISRIDVLVISRYRWSDRLASLVSFAKQKGVRVAFDCDDLVFDVSLIPTIMRTLDVFTGVSELDSKAYDYWFAYVGRLHQTAELADFHILSTRPLAEASQRLFGRDVCVVPNMVTIEQDQSSESIRRSGLRKDRRTITLGYFSGSPSHNRDFALIVESVAEVMRRMKNVNLSLVGFLDVPNWFSDEFSHRMTRSPLVDSETLLSLIAQVHLNLAPLQSNDFTRCKSELKYFDAALLGVPTICSDTGTIPECARESNSALFASDSTWTECLTHAIDLQEDALQAMADRALAVAKSQFSVAGVDYDKIFSWLQ